MSSGVSSQPNGNRGMLSVLKKYRPSSVLTSPGWQLTAVSCHPGLVRTELGRYFFNTDNIPLFPFGWLLTPLLIPGIYASRSPERGAQTQIYCAAEPTLQGTAGGEYFEDCHISTPSKDARDRQMAARLWEVSEKLTGASWNA
mmetsp:Transcript_7316/g.17831  ORF Transcript_7316/g.17831 Transcript_7316/m.17831 type:complete len:143 (-) Transcript_7316:1594-2022(-)